MAALAREAGVDVIGRAADGSWTLLPEQLSAVRAIVLGGDAAIAAWADWKAQTRGRARHPATDQLLPMLYARLRAQGLRDPVLDELRSAYALAWRNNLTLLKHLPPTVELLRSHAIDAMALKGTALLTRYYRDDGERMLADIDLLVPEQRFGEAFQSLKRKGWMPRVPYSVPDTRFNNAVQLIGPDASSIDLHCHVLLESCAPGADAGFWSRAADEMIHGVRVKVLSASDLLLLVLAHGTRGRSELPHLRWVVDAALIVGHAGIDWGRFVATAVEQGIPVVMHDALRRLSEWIALPVPGNVLEQLKAGASDPYALVIHRFGDMGHLGQPATRLRYHWAALTRGSGRRDLIGRLALTADYLRFWCQVQQLWRIPIELAVKLWRMVAFRAGRYRYPAIPVARGTLPR